MILMNDFKAEPTSLREAMLGAVGRVLESGWYVLGPEVESFERQWASTCQTKSCLGVGNGMDAIELILRALGIGPGDEVITTPMTAFATVLAILRAGAIPVLADIDAETGLMAIDSVRRCISVRTRAILLVHLYGQVRGMDSWETLCKEARVDLIEDCAQAHLAKWKGRPAGSFGVAGAWSFYPTKNLGAIGDGGAVVTDDEALAAKVSRLRNYGQSERYRHPELGMNSRLDELQAAILIERLRWLARFTDARRGVALRYRQGIHNPAIQLLRAPEDEDAHVHHLFVVRSDARSALQAHLKRRGIQSLSHYPVPAYLQEPLLTVARDPDGLANTEAYAETCLSIPCHPQMSDIEVASVIEAVNDFTSN